MMDDVLDEGVYDQGDQNIQVDAVKVASNAISAPSSTLGGVKGVLLDHKLHQTELRERQRLEANAESDRLYRQTHGAHLSAGEPSVSLSSQTEQSRVLRLEERRGSSSSSSSFSDSEHDNDEIMNQYRMQRIQELRRDCLSVEKIPSESAPSSHKHFGCVQAVTKVEFVDIVDRESKNSTTVLIHLYEEFVPECRCLNQLLEKISRQSLPHVCFLKLKALDTNPSFDTIALPAMMIYRGGILVNNFVRVHEEIMDSPAYQMEVSDVLRFLCQECKIS